MAEERLASRRVVLVSGAVGILGVATVGYELLRTDHGTPGRIPDVTPGRIVHGSFVSDARGNRRTSWAVAYPPGSSTSARLPLLVFLHGLHQDHRAAFGNQLGLDRFLAAHVAAGGPPFAIASVDGGTTYYHPRPDGEDAAAMVVDELVPLLAARGLRAERIGLMGLSMGGYGALRIGGLLGAAGCSVVVAESPAIWTNPEDASRPGFDGAAEYRRYSVFGHQSDLAGIPVRIDCGQDDPFHDATRAYVEGFPKAQHPLVGFQPGVHEMAYWRRMAPAQLRFVGEHLAD